jgi:hypothetical protein
MVAPDQQTKIGSLTLDQLHARVAVPEEDEHNLASQSFAGFPVKVKIHLETNQRFRRFGIPTGPPQFMLPGRQEQGLGMDAPNAVDIQGDAIIKTSGSDGVAAEHGCAARCRMVKQSLVKHTP